MQAQHGASHAGLIFSVLAGRSSLCNTYIPDLYDDIKKQVDAKIAAAAGASGCIGAIATDGWRKKAAEQGVSLINVCLLLPDGGAHFMKVHNFAAVLWNLLCTCQ